MRPQLRLTLSSTTLVSPLVMRFRSSLGSLWLELLLSSLGKLVSTFRS